MFKDVETNRGTVQVRLKAKDKDGHPCYEVFRDGQKLGEVWRYKGRIRSPIKGTRLCKEGKLRHLWAYKREESNLGPYRNITLTQQDSRLSCIASLIPWNY